MDHQVQAPEQQKALAIREPMQLADWDAIKGDSAQVVKRIKALVINGRKLNDDEAIALAAYAITNDLNPMSGECYYIPGVGPTPGVAGWRKKAQEQLDYECAQAGEPGGYITVEYERADPDESGAGPDDLAYKCIVRDSLSSKRWRSELYIAMRELKDAGVDDRYHEALKICGPEPRWEGIGVVYVSENFSRDGKPEKFDRHERAKKRAEKIALRKRFPRLKLPENGVDEDDVQVVQGQWQEYQAKTQQSTLRGPQRTEQELVRDLFGSSEQAPSQQPANEDGQRTTYSPIGLKARLHQDMEHLGLPTQAMTQQVAACMDYCLRKADGTNDDYRYEVLSFLAGTDKVIKSSKELPDARLITALHEYMQPQYDANGKFYYPAEQEIEAELQAIKTHLQSQNQPNLFNNEGGE